MSARMLSFEEVAVVLTGLLVVAILLVVPAVITLRDVRSGRPDPGFAADQREGGGGRARR